ncbi:GNAT family N-acetyltransferase [Anaerolineae bacterium CFX9]|jgi:GNAT superfamily N-acetyltransferase|nr:GNAT family N-acetyltransferase [Anaerolineae bacterium CFX9]
MSDVVIRKVETKADHQVFFEFPWRVYADDPNWVPPLLSMRRDLLDREHAPSWEYLEGDFFIAWRGEKPVGTIAAYINHRHNEYQNEHIGWFGAFEVYNDPEAAHALLKTAVEWVRERGYDAIRGPQTFTTHEECGLLVEGFERPILLMPYNKPYYRDLIESAGFKLSMVTYSFKMDQPTASASLVGRLERITHSIMRRNKITVRGLDPKNLNRDFKLFKDLYNAAWQKNWGFVPMTERELDALVKSLGMFVSPKLAFFGYVDDQPAGFMLPIPDFNMVLHRAYAKPGTPEFITLLKALYYWKIRPIMNWARVPLMGVKEEYRGKGVDVVMYYHSIQAMIANGIEYCDAGWILSINDEMMSILDNFGAQKHRTYHFYEYALK